MQLTVESIRGGYFYKTVDGKDMVECHVDDNEKFWQRQIKAHAMAVGSVFGVMKH